MSIKELKKKKEALIANYLALQDKADRLNDEIYQVTCEIEAVNLLIRQEEEKKRKKGVVKRSSPPAAN